MKKMLLATLLVVCATGVWAEAKPLACHEEGSVGLNWANGEWKVIKFKLRRFVLGLEGDTLSKISVTQVLTGDERYSSQVTCTYVKPQTRCEDTVGSSLYYDPDTNRGGIARLWGATGADNEFDTPMVSAFTCQPF